MKQYLVGGAVRDGLLGLKVKDHDWVVVGATAEIMLNQGFLPVGKDFPVFLHPTTHEEYALARTERKSAAGYTGFICYASPDVTLVEDLLRRDLTINAIAFDYSRFVQDYPYCKTPDEAITHHQTLNLQNSDYLIDPFNGIEDLSNRVLRHVSDAFTEDPLRILRLARFNAKFANLSFQLAPETASLIKTMIESGELTALTKERVWQETHRSLETTTPSHYFQLLMEFEALTILYPHFNDAISPYALACLDKAAKRHANPANCFAILMHDLLNVQGHCTLKDKKAFSKLFESLRIQSEIKELTWLVANHYQDWLGIMRDDAKALLTLLEKITHFKHPEQLNTYCFICRILFEEQEGEEEITRKTTYLSHAYNLIEKMDIKPILSSGLQGAAIKQAITELRIETLSKFINEINNPLNSIAQDS